MKLLRCAPLVLAVALAACSDQAPTTGSLVVAVEGLPGGATANVVVMGPSDYVQAVQGTTTLDKLAPGTYTVRVQPASHGNALYTSAVPQASVSIVAGKSENATVQYWLASGVIDLSVTGLPTGIQPNIVLAGPGGFRRNVVQGGTIGELPAGTYTVRADTITTIDGDRFGTGSFSQIVVVPVSLTAVPVSVPYALSSGTLTVNVSGLPSAQTASVSITGPGGFQRSTAVTAVYHGLLPGTYTITASKVYAVCPNVYVASQTQQSASVAIGTVVSRDVAYTLTQDAPANLNLRVDNVTLTQATQNYQNTVPMVAGRPALLRVFGVANQCNAARPVVRVTIGGTTVDLAAPDTMVATSPNDGSITSTWNYFVPGTLVQPGLTVSAQIDPANQVAEANESDNTFSANVDVRTVPVTKIKLIPVTISGSSTTGGVNAGNVDDFMKMARKLHPISAYDVEVKPTFTSSYTVGPLKSDGTGWSQVLGDMYTLQRNAQDGAYYYGVLRVTYTSGVAGLGYIGAPAAIGWDYLPNSAPVVLAHELGHNFGRQHTPCGNPGGIDPNYPSTGNYAGGFVGTPGYDPADSTFKSAAEYTDIMGYCNSQWISDYTYKGMMDWLLAHPMTQPATSASVQPSLLIWGRIENGTPVLEPAFEISARPDVSLSGPNRITAVDDQGSEIFSVPFTAARIADLPGDHEAFAIILPKSMLRGRTLATLRLVARGGTASRAQVGDVGGDPGATMTRTSGATVRLRWDATRYPAIMVRDAAGNVLSIARGGDATIVTGRPELDLNYSNGVRSGRTLIRVR